MKGSSKKGKKKDNITIDVNPDQVDDIETLEDPMNKVKLNSVFSKTKKKMLYIKAESEQSQVENMIENLDEDLKSFNSTFKLKMKSLQNSIKDYAGSRPSIPLISLGDL
jgi:hypothetical protein